MRGKSPSHCAGVALGSDSLGATSWRTSVAGRRGVVARPASSTRDATQRGKGKIYRHTVLSKEARREEYAVHARQPLSGMAQLVGPIVHRSTIAPQVVAVLILINITIIVSTWSPIRRQHVPAQLAPDLGRRWRRVVRARARVHVVADKLLARWDSDGHGSLAKVAP